MTDMTALTDYELITRVLDGENDFFEELVNRYKNLIYSIILRMTKERDNAADLTQEIFIKVYKNLDKYYPEYRFSTWVMRITQHHIIDMRRKRKQETVSLDEAGPIRDATRGPEETLLAKERRDFLAGLLDKLPEMYRIPIVLYHQHGMSYQEIADAIGEPLSKVKNRIFRGRKLLRQELENSQDA